MGILDEAIREHLELKRQHGAGDSELKQLEDEAFGPPERPGAEGAEAAEPLAAEAPTEFMAQPEEAAPQETDGGEAPAAQRAPHIADLQEAPEAEPSAGPSTAEREAIAEQPTVLYDVEGELGDGESPAPSEEELVEEEIGEPRLAPVDPLAVAGAEEVEEPEDEEGPEPEPEAGVAEEDEDEEFWSEQRLSEELDQALEAPEEEDLLEETPDFLEEAPEDDELWFEQKPPKDFDFDD